jgi:hypothetical protein
VEKLADADFAPGLPKKTEYGKVESLKAGEFVDFIVQKHEAEKAGTHFDVRIGTPQTGLLSWATRKNMPKPGERIALFQQPVHRHEYGQFEGEITEGYGKGKVTKHDEGRLLVSKISPNALHFTLGHKKFPERFVLVRPREEGDKRWLLMNTTPTEPIPYKKLHYTKIDPEKAEGILEGLQPGSSVQAKIDGAASLTKLMDDKLEVVSYRASKQTGGPIIHTERLFKGQPVKVTIPKEYVGSVLRGELYGTRKGKAIPPQELGGILNASLVNAVEKQDDKGTKLKQMLFDVQQIGKKPTAGMPYEERMEELKKIVKLLPPEHFELPEEAKTPEEAIKLFRRIKSGKDPLTHEGIVIHRPHLKPVKAKFMEDHDVYIAGFFPGGGKYKGKAVGGFKYSLRPGGPIVGEVGTGFSDKLRKEMYENPGDFMGRVAKVRAQEKLPSGALRAPALLSLHEDYPAAKAKS